MQTVLTDENKTLKSTFNQFTKDQQLKL